MEKRRRRRWGVCVASDREGELHARVQVREDDDRGEDGPRQNGHVDGHQ